MANIIKFRVKLTLTTQEEKEMIEFISLIEQRYTDHMIRHESRFHTDYEFATEWQYFQDVRKLISEKSIGRPYLQLL